ncbi:endonuclease/exonuclease/phosphatase family protein [Bacteroides sp. 519]|uniref:endonuclease/exonuclease/phosphatase family protein n=1 Tax=Bacteroides sp. 519 TaxID=2302937 RepID=UPI0013D5A616|nr:endonuclease/exonuclease/phosphatase family protein [Bacteroides sp. 519]NDV60532.1 endonuclease/exonuclease/phosphatase family protein [Bacteroides sp. 519]
MKRTVYLLLLICLFGIKLEAKEKNSFTVLQLNIWHEGSKVPDGYQGILSVLDQADADVVFLCEIRNPAKFMENILKDLKAKGKQYYGETLGLSVGILSKYKPESIVKSCIVPGDEHRAMLKALIPINGQPIYFYSCHLDYTHYECYMPRGYSGTTWKKIDAPVTNEATILEANRLSYRDESIRAFIKDAEAEIKKGYSIVMGGDFNEPSHLDWQADTKNLFDHNGAIVNWDCSVMLHKSGFKDAYREKHPDPIKYPGFTFPAGNKLAEEAKLEILAWAPEADERDRIDFIYYFPVHSALSLQQSVLVGPSETVLRGKIIKKDSKDKFFVPKGIWPTDHKGNLARFKVKSSN